MEYRANFFIGAMSTVIVQVANLIPIWAVMLLVPSLQGWGYNQVLLIIGIVTLAKSLNHMFADNLWTLGIYYIRSGEFDHFLVRPINPLFHLLADRFCHDGIGTFLVGLALLVQSSSALGITWTPLKLLNLGVAILSGGIIFIALNLITAVTAFWTTDSRATTMVVFNTHEFAKYPLTMYDLPVRLLMTWVVPYGLAAFYPASYLLGRDATWLGWISPIMAALLLLVAYQAWLFGLRHYSSTGS